MIEHKRRVELAPIAKISVDALRAYRLTDEGMVPYTPSQLNSHIRLSGELVGEATEKLWYQDKPEDFLVIMDEGKEYAVPVPDPALPESEQTQITELDLT